MSDKFDRDKCIGLLKEKQQQISASGENRFPKRSDFSDEEVCAIKAFLGPWPRALEAAELKEPRDTTRLELNREKRIRAKRRRTEALKIKRKGENP